MLIRWFLLAPLDLICSVLAVILSPILALISLFIEKDKYVQALPGFLKLFHTHDAPLDELWINYPDVNYLQHYRLFKDKNKQDLLNSRFLRYMARMFWIQRNAGYGFSDKFGFDMRNSTIYYLDKEGEWDSGSTNWQLTKAINNKTGKRAWSIRVQWFFYKNHYLRLNLGWKLTMYPTAMITSHINPFRKWKQ